MWSFTNYVDKTSAFLTTYVLQLHIPTLTFLTVALPETEFVDHLTDLTPSSCQRSCWMAHIMNCTCVNCNKYSNSNNYMTLTDRVIILSNSITGAIWKSNTKYWKVKWKINKGTISNYRPGETLSNQVGTGGSSLCVGLTLLPLLEYLKPNYFKKQRSLSSFLLTYDNNTGPKWQWRT